MEKQLALAIERLFGTSWLVPAEYTFQIIIGQKKEFDKIWIFIVYQLKLTVVQKK